MRMAAIVIGATLLGTVGASAQGVQLRVGPGTDRVYVDRDRDVYRDRDRRDWRDSRANYRERERRERMRDRDYDRYERRPGIVIER